MVITFFVFLFFVRRPPSQIFSPVFSFFSPRHTHAPLSASAIFRLIFGNFSAFHDAKFRLSLIRQTEFRYDIQFENQKFIFFCDFWQIATQGSNYVFARRGALVFLVWLYSVAHDPATVDYFFLFKKCLSKAKKRPHIINSKRFFLACLWFYASFSSKNRKKTKKKSQIQFNLTSSP